MIATIANYICMYLKSKITKMTMNRAGNYHRLYLILIIIFIWGCDKQKEQELTDQVVEDTIKVGFYNVENLFDTSNDPENPGDDEFTPDGELKWTLARYKTKLSMLTRVVEAMDYPEVLGLAEVENKQVLEDWVSEAAMASHDYQVAHLESNDYRGIDAGLIYRANAFQVLDLEDYIISFPDDPDYRTRDILMVKGVLEYKDTLTIFINHFPSRRGGQERSEPKRIFVATQLRKLIDNTFNQNPDARIIVMGDFNDEPFDQSIADVLGAQKNITDQAQELYNPMWKLTDQGIGSYNYRDNWQMLDQIILSGELLDEDEGYKYVTNSADVLKKEWLLQQSGNYKGYPDRTYAGDNYLGGYSDHLPVLLELYLPAE